MTREENVQWLTERVTELGFHKTNMDIYLDGCYGLDTISLFQRDRIGDDEMSYQLQITPDKQGDYRPVAYEATLLCTHPIIHGIYAGIDTHDLEQRMKQTDWKNFTEWNVSDRYNSKIINDIFQLLTSGDARANDVANRLELRYWLHTPMEQKVNILSGIENYQKKFDFELTGDLADMHVREAYNLLSGRSVAKFYINADTPNIINAHWQLIENGKLKTLPEYGLKQELDRLPITELKNDNTGPGVIYGLIRGERVKITLEKDGQAEVAFMQADPQSKSVKLFSAAMTELNIAAFQLNDVQKHHFNKKISPPGTNLKNKNTKRKGRSL